MRNTGLDEAQAEIKIAGRNINNLRYADDTTLMAESKEELKSIFINVKEKSEKVGLKFSTQKSKITTCSLKNNRMISVHFQGKPFSITVIQVYALTSNAEEAEIE